MEENQIVIKYLDRHYSIFNNKCINSEGSIVTGDKIVENMITIFTLSEDVCVNIVKEWSEINGLEKSVSGEIKWVIPKKVCPPINIEINQHIGYSPKRQNLFLVNMPEEFGMQQWLIQKASRPSTRIIINDSDDCVIKYEPMVLVCNDGPLLAQRLNIILRERPGESFDFSIEMLDPTGIVVEDWVFTNCYFEAIDFGPLDMSSSNIVTCIVTIRIGNVILN